MERISLIWWQEEGGCKILWKEMEVSHHAERDYKMTERRNFDVDLMGYPVGGWKQLNAVILEDWNTAEY